MKKHILLLVTALLILLPLLTVGCNNNQDNNEENDAMVNDNEQAETGSDNELIYPESEQIETDGITFYFTTDSLEEVKEYYLDRLPDHEFSDEGGMAYLSPPAGGSGPTILLWLGDDGINIEID